MALHRAESSSRLAEASARAKELDGASAGQLGHPRLVRSPDGSVYLRDGTERKMR